MISIGTVVCVKTAQELPDGFLDSILINGRYKELRNFGSKGVINVDKNCYTEGKPCTGCDDCPGEIDLGYSLDCYGYCHNDTNVFLLKQAEPMVILENGNIA